MSTPDPKEGASEAKPPTPTIGKEEEAKVNGRTSPTAPAKQQEQEAQSEPAPKGSEAPTAGDSGEPNGVGATDDKETESADPVVTSEKEPTPNKSSEPEPTESAESMAKPTNNSVEGSAEPAKDGDVEMEDVATQPAATEPPATDNRTTSAATNDVPENQKTMADAAAPADQAKLPAKVNGVHETSEKTASPEKAPCAPSLPSFPSSPVLAPSAPKDDSTSAKQPQPKTNQNESKPSPIPEDTDVTMQDAPTALAKTPREREDDDNEDQPLAKRQRTEPREEEVMVSTTAEEAKGPNALQNLDKWNDEEVASQPISLYQVREYRKAIAGVKKTKAGANFKDAVVKVWPGLADAYLAKVTEPMDLGELERRLRDGAYSTFGEFKHDLGLLYGNSFIFNGETHDVTMSAFSAVETIWNRCLFIPAEEPPKSKQTKHMPSRHHEPRAAAHAPAQAAPAADAAPQPTRTSPERPASVAKPKPSQPARRAPSASATSPTEKAKEQQAFAVPPGGLPQIRRASTQTEGDRPKRAIMPPKSKDIDYTTKATNKKHQRPEMQFCAEVLREVTDKKHYHLNAPFLQPVDPVALNIPTYYNIIKKPMDLSTIEEKLGRGEYSSEKQFHSDMNLMFDNCFKFNAPEDGVHSQGKQLKSLFQAEWAKKDQWLSKHAPSKPASVVSDVQSDEESDAGPEPAPVDDHTVRQLREAIDSIQEQLNLETQRANNYYAQEVPNEHMINAQHAVMVTIQKNLLDVKQKLLKYVQKQPAPPKPKAAKATKATKAKGGAGGGGAKKGGAGGGGGGGGGRKSGGGAGAKKAPKKDLPILTESDKNEIAQAVGTLDSPYIEQAISIIKKDTGQAENDSGELELDIEQLSQPALRKLADICTKAMPTFKLTSANELPTPVDSPAVNTTKAAAAEAAKNKKKRKPMQAGEQEERIKAIKNRLDLLQTQRGQGGQRAAVMESVEDNAGALVNDMEGDSSDEDSEEE